MTIENRIRNRKIGILGMARSGMAVAFLAEKYGGIPFLSDHSTLEQLREQTELLTASKIGFETGGHTEKLLESDYIILSPGVPLNIEILKSAKEKGIPLFSEIEFASWICKCKIVAVTGSNGKTTTVSLIGELLTGSGLDSYVCGNIGLPFCEVVDKIPQEGIAIVEVSTFQLESIEDFKPDVAVILNLSPDHLDRHGTFENYKNLKYRIAENQGEQDLLIINKDDSEIEKEKLNSKPELNYFSIRSNNALVYADNTNLYWNNGSEAELICSNSEISIPGKHNLQNAAAAVAVAKRFNVSNSDIKKALHNFPGVEHRMESMGQIAGISFINDSKATNVGSVVCALQAIESPIYLIAGGRDKGSDFAGLIESGTGKIKSVVAIGEAKDKIFNQLGRNFKVLAGDSMEDAVKQLFELAIPGETILLSPGCASFDMYKNFEERGRDFKSIVKKLKNGKSENETVSK